MDLRGVEFNWPHINRPATFMPVELTIERDPDGVGNDLV